VGTTVPHAMGNLYALMPKRNVQDLSQVELVSNEKHIPLKEWRLYLNSLSCLHTGAEIFGTQFF